MKEGATPNPSLHLAIRGITRGLFKILWKNQSIFSGDVK